jgi:hypothetical protein
MHGDDAIKTLLFCETLCMAAVSTLDPTHLSEVLGMIKDVLQTRKQTLGREHAHTLLSTVNLALFRSCRGNLEATEQHILHGPSIEYRNLEDEHIPTFGVDTSWQKMMKQQFR